MKRTILTATILLALWAAPLRASDGIVMEKVARVKNPALPEISGIVASRTHPGVFWVHNDSGNPPRLFAIDANGATVAPSSWIGGSDEEPAQPPDRWPGIEIWSASNVDWEDIAIGGGLIYIPDMGNNDNARRNLGIYVIEEPDPSVSRAVRPLRFLPVAYPDQHIWPAEKWHFDCEAVFHDRGKLYFMTKHRRPGQLMSFEAGTVLYRLDGDRTDKENTLIRVGSHPKVTLATAADLSPSGDRLALLTYKRLWIFHRPETGDDWLSGPASSFDLDRTIARQNEAITWLDESHLLMANESGDLIRLTLEP